MIFVLGAAVTIPRVHNDLEDRLSERLADDGVDGVSISFSGQDGTITCDAALDDPAAVRERAESLHGVRVIELDRSCTDSDDTTAPADSEPPSTEPPTTEAAASTVPPSTEPATTEPATTEPPVTQPPLESLVEIVGGDPLFRDLSGVLSSADLLGADGLGGDGPLTVLAPTNAAFDAAFEEFGADAFEELISDPDRLRTLLLHHVTAGDVRAADFAAGPIDMLDESEVIVDPDAEGGITFTSASSVAGVADPATQLDIVASNGVVHAIDQLLLPEGFEIAVDGASTTIVSLVDGRFTLSGTVQSEAQRDAIVTAAEAVVDPANVVDELVVDDALDVLDDDVARLGTLIDAMPVGLVEGEATLVDGALSLVGVAIDADATVALDDIAASADASAELSARPVADVDAAQALQDELNEFVALNPILFEPSSTELTADANAVTEQVAARALRLDGVNIEIVGHTDTDGDADDNQILSDGRAAAVLDALVDEGLDATTLTSRGEGANSPILGDDGAEDKAASRRVEFVVTVAAAET